MKIHVEMDELQFEKYKKSIEKQKELTDFPSTDLALALLNVLEKEDGITKITKLYAPLSDRLITTYKAEITLGDLVISLIANQYREE